MIRGRRSSRRANPVTEGRAVGGPLCHGRDARTVMYRPRFRWPGPLSTGRFCRRRGRFELMPMVAVSERSLDLG
jgi:hypothetical protein